MSATSFMLTVSHLTKVYETGGLKTTALNDVSFSVNKGEFVAIMGPSGSGKSTLMHILGALDTATSGQYTLHGQSVSNLDSDQLAEIRNRQIGFIFQAYNLLPRTTALQNVMLPMAYAKVALPERKKRATAALTQVGLQDRLHYLSNQLSGGQQQRVAIARGIVMNPALLLADEPTGNLASQQAEEIMAIFSRLHKEGRTIVMITHERGVAAHAKRILQVRDGQLVKDNN